MRAFNDILVMPTQGLHNGLSPADPFRLRHGIFRGGPVWPRFALQVRARHCVGSLPVPRDRRPRPAPAQASAEAGIWCGPASPHFGHAIADFGMRIAGASRDPSGLPLVFSVRPGVEDDPPPFFGDLLDHFRVPRGRVHLVRVPTRYRRLLVAPQAERLRGPAPSPAHLDLMDALVAEHGPVARDVDLLFVSRARYPDGRLVAEDYLDEALVRAGARVVHPETVPIAEQVALYRRARAIVFSEGSAVHGLQLLGRVEAGVAVLLRRPGGRIGRAMLAARASSLHYWNVVEGLVHGRDLRGRPQLERALVRPREADLLARFAEFGIDLGSHWDRDAYRARHDADLRAWVAYAKFWNASPAACATMQRCLDAAGVAIRVEAIAPLDPAAG